MNFSRQLLGASAVLGICSPMVASAAEPNWEGINRYASKEQVTTIAQFSDVKPTDWAYQALSNLIERYGCVAGYPGGTYKGGHAMTRFEAAALLNACLDRVSEVTDEIKKLMAEFEKELAVLKGRVDGLEAKVGVLEAQQFSTTTKLNGVATMVLGGATYNSNNYAVASRGYNIRGGALPNGLSFNYDIRLNFDTSFSGKDLLRTTLRAGNAGAGAFDFNNPVTTQTSLYDFFQEPSFGTPGSASNVVAINRLFYQFPIGSGFTATFGGRVRQDDMLAMWPSVYPSSNVLDLFSYAGSPLTYALNLGGGAGLWWEKNGFSISANYVSANAGNGSPGSPLVTTPGAGGVGNNLSVSSTTLQVGYAADNWGLAAAYAFNQNISRYNCTNTCFAASRDLTAAGFTNSTNSLALSGYWQPIKSGYIPSVSAGWGISTTQFLTRSGGYTGIGATVNSWTVGLQWNDVFAPGNQFGMGFGQAPMISKWMNTANPATRGIPDNGNWAWEWWYQYQLTDNISVTPGIFYLSRPLGGLTPATSASGTSQGFFNVVGYLLKTTFKF